MSWVFEAKKCIHIDERQMQTGAVAEEQIARYPQLASLVRKTERTCDNGQSKQRGRLCKTFSLIFS